MRMASTDIKIMLYVFYALFRLWCMSGSCNLAMKYDMYALFRQKVSMSFSDIRAKCEVRVAVLLII